MHFLQGRSRRSKDRSNEQKNNSDQPKRRKSHCISNHAERKILTDQTHTVLGSAALKDERLAERYMGGWIYVIRLTVDDYHRYCYVQMEESQDSGRFAAYFIQ